MAQSTRSDYEIPSCQLRVRKGMQFDTNVPEKAISSTWLTESAWHLHKEEHILSQVGSVLVTSNPERAVCSSGMGSFEKGCTKNISANLFSRSPIEHIQKQICDATVRPQMRREFTQIISHVIDFKSGFTACHSAGVAGCKNCQTNAFSESNTYDADSGTSARCWQT